MGITVIRSSFRGAGRDGDFAWMIEQPEHARTLFVFNDNESQFDQHQSRLGTAHRCPPGGGNAVIRPYQCVDPARATGIPTGDHGGYRNLDEGERAIDAAVAHLNRLLATGRYDAVAFSWNESDQALGTGIFDVDLTVRRYIVEQIELTAARH